MMQPVPQHPKWSVAGGVVAFGVAIHQLGVPANKGGAMLVFATMMVGLVVAQWWSEAVYPGGAT